ncbi:auxin response factor 4-like isoform X1 [Juglans microcarpa x Juglans regia]|uniref:auxin response factor 4-like isoform X1 n=2 Tax=Juglans microcarpa x Juglans regia TaxID=2249226 RepID=UPI001B7F455D|nr:auxin response factor 4-like isoform X1 [Juglans microcarpa x Juglans regia]XP_041016735.1 auxin response factor 4-like isoform X1 [Juglans microcarpa x Juglans regia]
MGSVGDLQGANLSATVSESDSRARMGGGLPADQYDQGERDILDAKLWHACAGPRVYVPRPGEKVFYFPQGHMEQVEAYTQQDGMREMPIYNVPSKILCKVVNVHLKAEAQTDEVFAQVTLLPEPEQDRLILEDETALSSPPRTSVCSFVKKLTASDTSTHGGFSVRKPHARKCFPPLDMSQQPPVQELVARDLQGLEWNFRHVFRGRPKRHLLTSGWSTFVTAKKLVAGDACIFLRGENGQLRVGVRRAVKLLNNASASVISGSSMHHGILASASHAVSTGTLFTVYYRPWTSPSEFIIPSEQYMKLSKIVYSVGTRFTMPFEGEECSEKRFSGTIVGVENIDCIRWPGSEWRCLKVQWDRTSDTFLLQPERVSPWNIELIESTNKKPTSTISERKRTRSINASLPGFSSLTRDGLFHGSIGYASKRHKEVLQGQENKKTSGQELDAETLPTIPHLLPLSDPDWCHRLMGLENKPCFPIHDHFHQHNRSTISCPGGNIMAPCPTYQWPPIFANEVCDNISVSRNMISVSNVTISNSGSHEFRSSESRDENDGPLSQPTSCARYMLFGVNLANSHPELPSPQVATYCELSSPCSFPPTSESCVSETIQVSESSKNSPCILLKKQCENCSVTNRSCTKVLKHGTALGRSVDLVRFNGYDELISEFDEMFDFKGSLIDGSSGWHVTYTDYEGDMMLIGDCPWQEFCFNVQKMFICPKDEIDKLIQTQEIQLTSSCSLSRLIMSSFSSINLDK